MQFWGAETMRTHKSTFGRCIRTLLLLGMLFPAGCTHRATPLAHPSPPAVRRAKTFDLDRAIELATLSLQAYTLYSAYTENRPFSLPEGYVLIERILPAEPFGAEGEKPAAVPPLGFLASREGNVYIVLRGTVLAQEWLEDAKVCQVPYPYRRKTGMTHKGFTRVYRSVRLQIMKTVGELARTRGIETLYVTGHSLGGAVAMLAAVDLHANLHPRIRTILYTFAQPRTGSVRFTDFVDEQMDQSWRIVNRNDSVCGVPGERVFCMSAFPDVVEYYATIRNEYYLDFGEKSSSPDDFVANHAILNYLAALRRLRQGEAP